MAIFFRQAFPGLLHVKENELSPQLQASPLFAWLLLCCDQLLQVPDDLPLVMDCNLECDFKENLAPLSCLGRGHSVTTTRKETKMSHLVYFIVCVLWVFFFLGNSEVFISLILL